MAICDGGGGALGHPIEWIPWGKTQLCIYCGVEVCSEEGWSSL
ncbi:hypothetical protein ACHAWO_000784, partial [Cyclotella atomus]